MHKNIYNIVTVLIAFGMSAIFISCLSFTVFSWYGLQAINTVTETGLEKKRKSTLQVKDAEITCSPLSQAIFTPYDMRDQETSIMLENFLVEQRKSKSF